MESVYKRVGSFFQAHRLRMNFDEAIVAEYLAFESVNELERFESGLMRISLDQVFELANLYDIPSDEIVVLFYELAHSQENGHLTKMTT